MCEAAEKCKVSGTFVTTKTQEIADFWCKVGVPEEHCKKLVGTHWCMKVNACGKKVFCSQKCEEHPEYSSCGMYIEGVENVVPEMPGLGGKATMCFKKVGDNKYHSKMTHEVFGCVEWTEEFCDEGIKMDMCCKEKGASVCEKWCRKVCETGAFKFHKVEGDINAILAPVFGPEMKIDECFKECIKKCGDGYMTTMCLGQTKVSMPWKLDEECDFEGTTSLTTRTGMGKFKAIQKKGGHVLEWTTCFGDCGYMATVCCHKTGKTAKLWMERYCEMSGCYKPICYAGVKEVGAAMGLPAEMVDKMLNDCKALVCIKAQGLFHHHTFKSSVMPFDVAFKLGEEFEFAFPFAPTEKEKCLYVKKGNCLMGTSKGKFDTTTKLTFTENFMIQEVQLCGTPLCEKIIYSRVCDNCSNCC